MSNVTNFFFKNPVGKFLFDVIVGGALGAGAAAYALPGDGNSKLAFGFVLVGTVKGVFAAAREGLLGAIQVLRDYQTSRSAPPPAAPGTPGTGPGTP